MANQIDKELISDYISDLSIDGKYRNFYETLMMEIDEQYPADRIEAIKNTLKFVGINVSNMDKLEILYEYSKLI